MAQANCAHCGKEFQYKPTTRHPVHLFCSVYCSNVSRAVDSNDERFWRYVNKTESCWLWTGGKVGGGYGIFWTNHPRKMQVAHRFCWELLNGPIPKGFILCHDCPGGDNPACVNPDHLFVGTHKDNTNDASQKGTLCKGEDHVFARLSEVQVIEIRSLHGNGEKARMIAPKFGVTADCIRKITSGKNWKHLLP